MASGLYFDRGAIGVCRNAGNPRRCTFLLLPLNDLYDNVTGSDLKQVDT